eukprot:14026936-Heterocapsa_arctica.AAC.1
MQKKDKVEQTKELQVLLAERRRMRHELAKQRDAGQLQCLVIFWRVHTRLLVVDKRYRAIQR